MLLRVIPNLETLHDLGDELLVLVVKVSEVGVLDFGFLDILIGLIQFEFLTLGEFESLFNAIGVNGVASVL